MYLLKLFSLLPLVVACAISTVTFTASNFQNSIIPSKMSFNIFYLAKLVVGATEILLKICENKIRIFV